MVVCSNEQAENRIKKYETIKAMHLDYVQTSLTIYELNKKYGFYYIFYKKIFKNDKWWNRKSKRKKRHTTQKKIKWPLIVILFTKC